MHGAGFLGAPRCLSPSGRCQTKAAGRGGHASRPRPKPWPVGFGGFSTRRASRQGEWSFCCRDSPTWSRTRRLCSPGRSTYTWSRQGVLLPGRGGGRRRAPAPSGEPSRRLGAPDRPSLAAGRGVRRLPVPAGPDRARAPRAARCGRSYGKERRSLAGRPTDREQLQGFTRRLDALRGRVGRPGLSRLIDDALTACDYDLVPACGAQGSAVRQRP